MLISVILASGFANESNLFAVKNAYASDEPPKSYWKLDGNMMDSGSLNVTLYNTYPFYACNVNATTFCYDTTNPSFAKVEYHNSTFGKNVYFNGYTHLATSFADQSKYSFLESNHPFTLEAWIVPDRLCVEGMCDHHYFLTKVITESDNVIGVACGQQDDGALYCYLRNANAIIYKETSKVPPNDIPLKFDFTYNGNGTFNGMLLYINGQVAQTKPLDPLLSNSTLTGSILNTEPLVIGNYWIKWINPWTNAYVDEVKIYDYDRTSKQILEDFQSDIANKPNWNFPVNPKLVLTGQGDDNGIGLNWNSITNATYEIDEDVDDGNWTALTPNSYTVTELNDYNVTQNHVYSYRISAWNNGTEVAVSNVKTIEFAQAVPEFGTIAELVIILSIIGAIAISKKFKWQL